MEPVIVISVIIAAGFVSGYYVRDREERRRRRTAKRINLL
jgi:hypothetical protein